MAQMVRDRAGAGTQVSDALGIKQSEHLYMSELDEHCNIYKPPNQIIH